MPPPPPPGRHRRRATGSRGEAEHAPAIPAPDDSFRPCYRDLPPCQEEEHVTEPASAQTLQQTDVSSLTELLDTTRLKESSITATPSGRSLSSSPGSTILVRKPPDWYFRIYIRIDRWGSFHTYPHLGGPFQSLQEAENAIDRHLHDMRHPTMWKEQDEVSQMDRIIQQSLYWPDGTCKKYSKSQVLENTRKQKRQLVQALVDKYNEDHNLLGDLAYELKDVVQYQSISENHIWYNHFNLTMKTKGTNDLDGGIDNLFFAEVTYMERGHELVVSCFCMVEPNENGHCYGCTNNGSVDMKHPDKADAYAGGHLDGYLPYGCNGKWEGCNGKWEGSDENVEAEKARLRRIYKGLDDPSFLEKYFTPPPYSTPMGED